MICPFGSSFHVAECLLQAALYANYVPLAHTQALEVIIFVLLIEENQTKKDMHEHAVVLFPA